MSESPEQSSEVKRLEAMARKLAAARKIQKLKKELEAEQANAQLSDYDSASGELPRIPASLNLEMLGKFTGLDTEIIVRAAKAGYFVESANGDYESTAAIQGLFRYITRLMEKRGRPPTGSQSLPSYQSMAACSSATGIPLMILKQAKAEGCEAFRFSRVDLGIVLQFLFTPKKKSGESGSQDSEIQNQNQNAILNYWRARREKLRFEHETHALASKEEVSRDLIAAMAELYGSLDRVFCNQLPPSLIGLEELEIRRRCRIEIETMKSNLRARFKEYETAESAVDSPASDDSDSSN